MKTKSLTLYHFDTKRALCPVAGDLVEATATHFATIINRQVFVNAKERLMMVSDEHRMGFHLFEISTQNIHSRCGEVGSI